MGYIILILLTIVASVVIVWLSGGDSFEIDMSVLMGMIIGGLIIVPLFAIFFHAAFDSEEYVKENIQMVALKDNMATEGKFFLGSGTVDSSIKYFYMTKTEKGLKIDSVNASDSYLVEDDSVNPYIEIHSTRFKNEFVEKWFPNWYSGYTIIHIPKGSILYNYQVDLQ